MIFFASLSMSKLNTSIGGLEEGCAKAMEVAKEKNIGNYAYYRFKTADNLDVYLGKELKKLEGNDLENLSGTILFVKSTNTVCCYSDILVAKLSEWSFCTILGI